MKTWVDLHEGEQFTDNSLIENCKQCKTCKHRDDGTIYSNNYQKAHCVEYPNPEMKPMEVIKNTRSCHFYEKE